MAGKRAFSPENGKSSGSRKRARKSSWLDDMDMSDKNKALNTALSRAGVGKKYSWMDSVRSLSSSVETSSRLLSRRSISPSVLRRANLVMQETGTLKLQTPPEAENKDKKTNKREASLASSPAKPALSSPPLTDVADDACENSAAAAADDDDDDDDDDGVLAALESALAEEEEELEGGIAELENALAEEENVIDDGLAELENALAEEEKEEAAAKSDLYDPEFEAMMAGLEEDPIPDSEYEAMVAEWKKESSKGKTTEYKPLGTTEEPIFIDSLEANTRKPPGSAEEPILIDSPETTPCKEFVFSEIFPDVCLEDTPLETLPQLETKEEDKPQKPQKQKQKQKKEKKEKKPKAPKKQEAERQKPAAPEPTVDPATLEAYEKRDLFAILNYTSQLLF
ncbi:hypothetical protein F5Y11DRAFT_362725 [Daldinia sp. FL1419]|nr:hypothetical protein F5Y11DRAFT_362725 [Daldinia sp. FL1419]